MLSVLARQTHKTMPLKGHSHERADQADPASRPDPGWLTMGQQDPWPPADAALN
jgi:hypothetical protein